MDAHRYIPALRYEALTRFFDPVVRVTTRERRFKQMLVEQVGLKPGQRVLDVGCGTGTLAIELKTACRGAHVHGVDGDPTVLAIARDKINAKGIAIELHRAMAWEPPFADGTLDRVVSSLVFHHLDRDAKLRTLRALYRVLAVGGELHIADWGRAHGFGMRTAFLAVQALDGFATTTDSVEGRLPGFIAEAGFQAVEETRRLRTPLGTISLYRAQR